MSVVLDRRGNLIDNLFPDWDEGSPGTLPSRPSLLTLARFLDAGSPPGHAVLIPNTADIAAIPAPVLACPLLVLDYPLFADGRAYSQAKLLSRLPNFTGQLRARGNAVVYDQLRMLRTCGFTEFQLRSDQDAAACAHLLQA